MSQNALNAYNTLRATNPQALPELTAGDLHITTQRLGLADVKARLAAFNARQGWLMSASALRVDVNVDDYPTIGWLEGEWVNANKSHSAALHHLQGDEYQWIEYSLTPTDNTHAQQTSGVYREQLLAVRDNLKGDGGLGTHHWANYQLWWHTGNEQGAWQPLAQIFLGWATYNDAAKD